MDLIVAVTGHRPDKLGGYGADVYERLFGLAYLVLAKLAPAKVITGMAQGWDTAIAEAACMLEIPYDAYIPFEGQESQWPEKSKVLYWNLLLHAEQVVECSPPGYEPWKMMARNKRMIDDGNLILALWNGDASGGTAHAVRYAEDKGKEFMNVWPQWVKEAP